MWSKITFNLDNGRAAVMFINTGADISITVHYIPYKVSYFVVGKIGKNFTDSRKVLLIVMTVQTVPKFTYFVTTETTFETQNSPIIFNDPLIPTRLSRDTSQQLKEQFMIYREAEELSFDKFSNYFQKQELVKKNSQPIDKKGK